MFLVHNEQTKLTANVFNALAVSLVAAGVFAPVIAFLYGLSQASPGLIRSLLVSFGCFGLGGFLHWLGRRTLGRLQE
jgi:hypothetical protein